MVLELNQRFFAYLIAVNESFPSYLICKFLQNLFAGWEAIREKSRTAHPPCGYSLFSFRRRSTRFMAFTTRLTFTTRRVLRGVEIPTGSRDFLAGRSTAIGSKPLRGKRWTHPPRDGKNEPKPSAVDRNTPDSPRLCHPIRVWIFTSSKCVA
jgi:hypothetical protein